MTPCYGCDERNAECHAKCERYITWHNNRKNESVSKALESERDANGYVVNSIYRNKYHKNTRRG